MVRGMAVAFSILVTLATGLNAGDSKGKAKGDRKAKGKKNVIVLETTKGDVELVLFTEDAPKHSANFEKLVKDKFYDGIVFHRVERDPKPFVVQAGDPVTKKDPNSQLAGQGGATDKDGKQYTIEAEIKRQHKRGTLAMARTGDDVNPERRSSSSQFYLCLADVAFLDGKYTVFGEVTKGMDIVDKIVKGDKIKRAYVKK